ncbi:nucleolysin TIAR-like [Limulus polyphemus]|uniref:Nucleolysin TIAR-like n=1 Tax=Limulus polyphemus TaxID=6850 RepID=A0ABM1BN57_LIMPO|nr:nucleolysin TIAR-like [Limulus polyphemus]
MNGQWLGSRAIRTNWATRKVSANRNQNDDELIHKTFISFGAIQEIRVFKDKGYAFIRFATKEAATHAIVGTHNSEINGQIVKCSWGKESSDPTNQQQAQHSFLVDTPFAESSTDSPINLVSFPESSYFSVSMMGVQMASWQGIPGQPQMAAAAAAQSPIGQQPGVIGAYPLQQYQAQLHLGGVE